MTQKIHSRSNSVFIIIEHSLCDILHIPQQVVNFSLVYYRLTGAEFLRNDLKATKIWNLFFVNTICNIDTGFKDIAKTPEEQQSQASIQCWYIAMSYLDGFNIVWSSYLLRLSIIWSSKYNHLWVLGYRDFVYDTTIIM